MSMTDGEKRVYARGYASGAKWPLHKPPLPPQPIAREAILAAIQIRDAADGIAGAFGEGDEVAEKLWAEVERFDAAMEVLGRWLRAPDDGVKGTFADKTGTFADTTGTFADPALLAAAGVMVDRYQTFSQDPPTGESKAKD